jgi:hypothetical protein
MNNIEIEKINKIITKPIKNSQCLQIIQYDKTYVHPNINVNIRLSSSIMNNDDKICMTNYNKKFYKNYNNDDMIGIYSHFHLPINIYNLVSIVYNINNINELEIWIEENLDSIYLKTLNRLLYCYCISNIKDIINNIEIFINIIKKIFNKYNIDYNQDMDNKILDIIKNKKNLNIDFIDNLKKYLNNQK